RRIEGAERLLAHAAMAHRGMPQSALDTEPHRTALAAAGIDRPVVEAHGASLRLMTDGFDIVAVRIENKGTVVVRVVVGPQARCAIVLAARGHRRLVEGIDLGTLVGGEGI